MMAKKPSLGMFKSSRKQIKSFGCSYQTTSKALNEELTVSLKDWRLDDQAFLRMFDFGLQVRWQSSCLLKIVALRILKAKKMKNKKYQKTKKEEKMKKMGQGLGMEDDGRLKISRASRSLLAERYSVGPLVLSLMECQRSSKNTGRRISQQSFITSIHSFFLQEK